MLWLIFLAGVLSFESSFIGTFFPGTIFCSQCALLNCPRCAILSPVRYFVPGAIFCSQWAILSNVGYILSPVRYFVPGAIFCSQCAILSPVRYKYTVLSPVRYFVQLCNFWTTMRYILSRGWCFVNGGLRLTKKQWKSERYFAAESFILLYFLN